jgi:hypothetical protein
MWRGVSHHRPWIEDPDRNLVQVYARLTDEEFATRVVALEPTPLV